MTKLERIESKLFLAILGWEPKKHWLLRLWMVRVALWVMVQIIDGINWVRRTRWLGKKR